MSSVQTDKYCWSYYTNIESKGQEGFFLHDKMSRWQSQAKVKVKINGEIQLTAKSLLPYPTSSSVIKISFI